MCITAEKLQLESCQALFTTGAVVRLKGGGPKLTVYDWRSDGLVQVEWFIGAALQRDVFHPFQLELAS